MSAAPIRIVKAACPHDCPDTCALEVHVKDGVALKVTGSSRHAPTAGVLCNKVSRYTERTYHQDRLLYPQRRIGAKGQGRFERISWDEAIATIAERLAAVAKRGPERIAPYSYAGTMGLVQGDAMGQRLFHRIGASLMDRTICSTAGAVGVKLTLGARNGIDLEAVPNARLIVLWGANPIVSSVHFWIRVQEAKRRGAKIIAIDPYRSLSAEKCNQHVALLPGTDGALALGIMHILFRDDLIDHDYVDRHTLGAAQLRARAEQYPPERVASICGIAVEELETLAHDYGTIKPSLIRLNYGMQRARGGAMAARNVSCLPALVGAWRSPAGGVMLSSSDDLPVDRRALERPDLLGTRRPRLLNMSTIGAHLLRADPPIEAMVVWNSNPVAIAPQSKEVAAGFAREDLFTVVMEHFRTDTADYADILLPATTQLEHLDVVKPYGHFDVVANNAAIAPLGESRSNTDIFRAIAAAMGFEDACFKDSDHDIARIALSGDKWNLEEALEQGWISYRPAEGAARFAEGGFATPSGKVELWSERALAAGFDALPDYIEPAEDTRSLLAAQYPLAMISPPARNFLNSTFVNVDSLRSTEGEPWLDMHPADASDRNIADGASVRVFNQRGSLELTCRVTDRARPGLVVALSIWWKKLAKDGKNANELTSQTVTDMGNGPTFYDCLVQVEALPSIQ
jgi:anaerobic selenocysteine-containing dehydrogenase